MGKKMAGTNEFAFFRCRSICTGGGGVQNQAEKIIAKCLPAGTGTKIYFSSPAVESSIAVEDTVENRGLYRVFVSRLF